MKLKDIFKAHKNYVIAGGCALVLTVAWLAWAWFGASSTINVPKGTQAETNSNIEKQNAVVSETQANDIRDQRIVAHTDTVRTKGTLNQRKNDYEQTRKTLDTNGVSSANLDSRERKLQSDLSNLYPGNR